MAESEIKRRRGPAKVGGGKRMNRDARKERRRVRAAERQAAYDALTHAEKLAKARPNSKGDTTKWTLTPCSTA